MGGRRVARCVRMRKEEVYRLTAHRFGFVSLIGRPNVGKSTLLNRLLGTKLAITSDKAQTTRLPIQGVLTTPTYQMAFVDTPGIHKPHSALGRAMRDRALDTIHDVDVLAFVVDAIAGPGAGDRYIVQSLANVSTPVVLVLNKIERFQPDNVLPLLAQYQSWHPFVSYVPCSARTGIHMDILLQQLYAQLPEGPRGYPEDHLTDHSERFLCAEMIREQLLHRTREELPHSVAVVIERMHSDARGVVHIDALIVVERASQKGMVIGRKGALLKEVGQAARQEIATLLGARIFLQLWVKIQPDWQNNARHLRNLGLQDDADGTS